MFVYLIRHGQDDDQIRGGWSKSPLTPKGREEVHQLGRKFKELQIDHLYTSDLPRALETTAIFKTYQPEMPITDDPRLREMNNGLLAGMPNATAEKLYPNLYFRTLDWTEKYPEGESPELFYHRIIDTWEVLTKNSDGNICLVTHGGVINIILHHINKKAYSNKKTACPIPTASLTKIDLRSGSHETFFCDSDH